MKRCFIAILLLTCFFSTAKADHITGGEMYYSYSGFINGKHYYEVTLKLFMRCNSGRTFANPNIVSVFDRLTNARIMDLTVPLSQQVNINLPNAGPCISNPPVVCFEVAYYNFTVSLPPSPGGYLLAGQVNYRINGISNLFPAQVGATYVCEIPGTSPSNNGPANHSAVFTGSDLVVVCASNFFTYSFAAKDDDGDILRYSFCTAYASSNSGTNGTPPGNPPYNSIPYHIPFFSESTPLGNNVQVNPNTGLITGIAPPLGVYVVTVCVEEIRDGILIATQRKDIQINVADCNVAAAALQGDYMLCKGPSGININNLSNSPLITSYDWTVFNPAGTSIHTSTNQILSYNLPSPGTYTVQLIVNRGQQCSDTAISKIIHYPGFLPNFDYTGICYTKPSFFTDQTTTVTGTINSWRWDFGDLSTTTDVSSQQNAVYTYPSLGPRDVRLVVTNTDGCRDTATKTITIIEKPPITFAFRDTLICVNDQLQLHASGMGTFSWSPAANMINPNTPDPIVAPVTTTTYYADLNSDGCLNRDSVLVRVVDHVTLQAMGDTLVCSGDTIQLRVSSDGLHYQWTPANQFIDATAKNPFAFTPITTTYNVRAIIGGCSTNDQITVTAIPYPLANAGRDTIICYQGTAQLHAVTDGTSWQWTPAGTLSNPSLLNPVASPQATTSYILTVYENTRGCPKPKRDTVMVMVLPKIIASAGRDTAIVIGQELQLNASGGTSYLWMPASNLSSVSIPDPIALFREPTDGQRYKVLIYNEAGCVDSAFITVKVFATVPTVFVPTAFTPNNDGRNDILLPIAVGMKRIEYFNIYNRWGQLVFSTTINGRGWDGRINGQQQGINTYIWMVKAVDYKGTAYFSKGHSTLIR